MRKTLVRPDCQFQTGLQVKKGNSAVLELSPDDAFRREFQAIPIELKGTLQVIDAKSDDCHT